MKQPNSALGSAWAAESVFLAMGAIAGLCDGATQSASRTLVAVFSPASKAAERCGFRRLFGRLAAIFGLFSLGVLRALAATRHCRWRKADEAAAIIRCRLQ
jgi:UMF1 family MFS transporter